MMKVAPTFAGRDDAFLFFPEVSVYKNLVAVPTAACVVESNTAKDRYDIETALGDSIGATSVSANADLPNFLSLL